jgi:hypothetical protein
MIHKVTEIDEVHQLDEAIIIESDNEDENDNLKELPYIIK